MNIIVLKQALGIVCGAALAAIGLQAFLLPNQLIDGGIVGVSIIAAKLLGLPLGLFLIVFNLPFIYLGYKKLGRLFAVSSIIGISLLATVTTLAHILHPLTSDPLLAAVFGGAFIGMGAGVVIRAGGTLDGTEVVAIVAERKTPFTVGEIVMAMNLFILVAAGFIFGWDRAMYSLIAYFTAYKIMDMTVEGLDESKSVWIVSNEYRTIGHAIQEQLGRNVTYVNGQPVQGIVSNGVILSVITRLEEQKLKAIVQACDQNAFVVINNVHEVMAPSNGRKS